MTINADLVKELQRLRQKEEDSDGELSPEEYKRIDSLANQLRTIIRPETAYEIVHE